MVRDDVMARLRKHYDMVCEKYGKENVFFVSLYGSQNYGLDTPESDVDTKAVVFVPSYDMVWGKKISVEERLENDEHCEVKDVVTFCKMLLKQNLNFLEFFVTDYYMVNKEYKDFFYELRNYKNLVSKCDPEKLLMSAKCQAMDHYKKWQNTGCVNNKLFVNAYRLCSFVYAMLVQEKDLWAAANLEGDSNKVFLMELKTNKKMPSLASVEELEKKFAELDKLNYSCVDKNTFAELQLKTFCLSVYRHRLLLL